MSDTLDDEACAARMAQGDADALRILYGRYGRLVLGMALRSLGEAQAEEVVQDTFVTIWKNRTTFDPARGAFRPWLYQIARNRIANEHRTGHRSRSLEERAAQELDVAEAQPVDEAQWDAWRRRAFRAAIDALPVDQARALSLTFFEDLTHEQVAATLGVPLGTAKTRIRGGMKRLAVLLAAVVALVMLAVGARREWRSLDLQHRALVVATSSDTRPLRMTARPGVSPAAHATYRAHERDDVAVLTASFLPTAQRGEHFVAWVRRASQWTRLGVVEPGSDGRALLVAEDPAIVPTPDGLEITVETTASPDVPSNRVTVAWPE